MSFLSSSPQLGGMCKVLERFDLGRKSSLHLRLCSTGTMLLWHQEELHIMFYIKPRPSQATTLCNLSYRLHSLCVVFQFSSSRSPTTACRVTVPLSTSKSFSCLKCLDICHHLSWQLAQKRNQTRWLVRLEHDGVAQPKPKIIPTKQDKARPKAWVENYHTFTLKRSKPLKAVRIYGSKAVLTYVHRVTVCLDPNLVGFKFRLKIYIRPRISLCRWATCNTSPGIVLFYHTLPHKSQGLFAWFLAQWVCLT